ncbi:hypothetical protein ACFTXB_13825 [Streptomyces sp. NPDC057074]|uniref:hypothetical protein n=1 Tax=Streptomyces sp. NPDC057074 TaxID=3346015 RepID=UPI0036297B08
MPTTAEMPLEAARIPDCTELEAHRAAYSSAKANNVIFVCVARHGRQWKVQLDAMSSSRPYVPDHAMPVLRSAVEALVRDGTAGQGSVGADYISLGPIKTESRAREIAAAFHAAMYGLQQLHMTVPNVTSDGDS